MKKLLLLSLVICASLIIRAQSPTFVSCTAGTLSTKLTVTELSTTTDLIIMGTIDASDFRVLRDNMPLLSSLDISSATIVSYSGPSGTGPGNFTYPANIIPQYAFNAKTTLTSIKISSVITTIDKYAFSGCVKLSSFSFPTTISTIGDCAFYNCNKLYNVSFSSPSSLISIGNYAFTKCSTILSFTIPSNVNFIGEYAFSECTGMYYAIAIPSSVTKINTNTFYGCTYLSSISIPSSVTTIDNDAFTNCSALIYVDANNPNYSSINGVFFDKNQTLLIQCPTSLTGRYVIPSTVTTISIPNDYYGAFYGCKNLTSIVIPSSVTTINNNQTFGNCSGLKTLYANALYPIGIASLGTFDGASTSTCVLHVPYGSKKSYGMSKPWNYFSNIVEASVWNGIGLYNNTSNWSSTSIPVSGADIIVASGELIIDQSADINNLTINPGAKLTLQSWWCTITASGNVNILCDNVVTGSFVSNGTVTVNGTTTVQQYLTGSGTTTPNGRFWYISSPVKGATSATFDAAGANILKRYDESTHAWSEIINNTTTLPVGAGYFARLGATTTATFTGSLNTGDITVIPTRSGSSDAKRGFNLVGNPYPSYLNWDDVEKTNIQTTMWYRSNNGLSMVFDTYNSVGAVGTDNNGTAVNKFIPPMQAFWVRVSNDGDIASLTFKNSMRSHQTGNLLKSNTQNDIIRLKVSNGTNSDEAIVVFNADATNGIDAFDSEKMSNNDASIPELYTVANSQKLVINGLESAVSNPIIPLGFKTAKAGTYTITAKAIEGLNGVPVILEDKLLNKIQDLTQLSSYSFSSDSVDNASRFVLRLKSTTIVNEIAESINVYAKSQAIAVTTTETIGKITITDVLGRTIATQTIVGTQTDIEISSGVYFVKVQTSNGVVTKQVVVE